MVNILDEVMKHLPKDKVSDAGFEGANIVLYTKDKDFFMDNAGLVRKVVNEIKKRIELRPDPEITLPQEEAEKIIKNIIPEEAGVCNIIFDENRSRVIIEAEKPGLAIGKQGALLREIRMATLWVPLIRRTAPIRSELIENIRMVLYQNSESRRKFLDRVGHRIYDGWIRDKRKEWIRLSVLGGGRQVGRACYLLQTPESRVLLDCGMDISADDTDQYPHFECPEFKIDELDAILITHPSLEHCAMVPFLFKMGYRGPVYCTAPTRDLMSLMLLDVIKIARTEGKDPIFQVEDVKEMVKHTICLEYEEVTDVTPDVRLTFYNSGHAIGSSMCHMHIGNGLHNMLYTGNLKAAHSLMLDGAHAEFPRLESMLIESTYGGRDNVLPPPREVDEMIKDSIVDAVKRGGKVLIPTHGFGKAQELMLLVEQLVRKGKIEQVPVYLDGLVWDLTAIHTAYPEYLNNQTRKLIFHKESNPFLSDMFKRISGKKERKDVMDSNGACIIIATDGMLQGGPSLEYFRELAMDEKNLLMLSCYQQEGTLGREIHDGERQLQVRKQIIEMKMDVFPVDITNHSDRRQLMNYMHRINPKPKKVVIVHGENARCLDYASSVHKQSRTETLAPRNMESIRLK